MAPADALVEGRALYVAAGSFGFAEELVLLAAAFADQAVLERGARRYVPAGWARRHYPQAAWMVDHAIALLRGGDGALRLLAAGWRPTRVKTSPEPGWELNGRLFTLPDALQWQHWLEHPVDCPFCRNPMTPDRRCFRCDKCLCHDCGNVIDSPLISRCRKCECDEYRRLGVPY